jgi:hypothetical protein
MEDEQVGLNFEERALIACLMTSILDWNDDDRLEELCQEMTAGSKGAIEKEDYIAYKKYVKKTLNGLRERLGFG